MEKESVSRFFHDLKESKTICLLGHASPDGDCIGSAFALYEYLIRQENEKEITIALDGKIPYNYDSYIDKSLITSVPDSKIYDMIITFDCANENRFGCFAGILSRGRKTVCIDHHDTNTNFADINFVDEKASSTGELLYRMLKL